MLYTLHRGNVPGYTGGQQPIIHLASQVQVVYTANRPAVFTDGHAIMALSAFYTDLKGLDRIDWPLMQATFWNDTQEYPDRKCRRQAEYLVHQELPWDLITEIGVIDEQMRARVERLLDTAHHHPPVCVRREWYY